MTDSRGRTNNRRNHDDVAGRLARPLKIFAKHKFAGAVLLLAATLGAVVWANSPWAESYTSLLRTEITVGAGEFALTKPLILWINDGLMGVFFFLVGLEIKREFLAGELSSRRKAMLPVTAALGGMVVPALVYVALNAGGPGVRGWGVPMATDIAFSLGVLALFDVRPGLKVFLTALAIVDDIGAVIVIALFYTEKIALVSLLIGGAFLLISAAANYFGVRSSVFFFFLGTVVWLAFLKSGVHATLAAVLIAMTIPARTRIDGERFVSDMNRLTEGLRETGLPRGRSLLTSRQHLLLEEMDVVVEQATAPLQQLEHALVPLVAFVVMPLFALANAGVSLDAGLLQAAGHPVALGIVLGLFLGKPIGISLFAWLAVRIGWAELPAGVGWKSIVAVGAIAGIGFTMSLFVASLAFPGAELRGVAKLGILAASVLSAAGGAALLYHSTRTRREV